MAGISDWVKHKLRSDVDELTKSELHLGNTLPEVPLSPNDGQDIGRKAILDDPYFTQFNQGTLYKHKLTRISNSTLKDVSLRDWLVSSIIQSRVDTLLRFSRPQKKKFDMGYRIVKKNGDQDFTEAELLEISALEDFIYNCGRTKDTPPGDKMLFGKFLKMVVRDALTFGHVAIEKVKTRRGALHRFRPLPAETVYLVNEKADKKLMADQVQMGRKLMRDSMTDNDPRKKQTINEQPLEYYKYIQVGKNDKTLAVFGDEDLTFKLFNPQNFADTMGYCYSPLELAIINITNHLNVENYNANFFTHGYAARGILHLKGTVTQSQLIAFRRQFYNTISGTHNAWRTPIIAGLDDVQWVGMAGSAREMEYINFNNHLLRTICTQFQIDPMELGLDYLISNTSSGTAGGESNKMKIEYSRERGLYPILMFIEDVMNEEIISAVNPEFAAKYMFKFEGYTDETPQTEAALLQAEMSIHSTMNDLLRSKRGQPLKVAGADLPLNQAFWMLIEKNYTKGEIREIFFGDKGASQRRELQYIPGDPMFVGWQQMLMTLDAQKLQNEMQAQQQAMQEEQQAMEQEKHEREGEAHSAEMSNHRSQQLAGINKTDQLKDNAKNMGVGTEPLYVDGKPIANPINKNKK